MLNWAGNVAMGSWDGVATDSAGISSTIGVPGVTVAYGLTTTAWATWQLTILHQSTASRAVGDLSNLTLRIHFPQRIEWDPSIPVQLGSLSNLTQLSLIKNQLSGSIPVELGNLSNLTYLGLGWNELSGSIPTQLLQPQ